MKTSLKENKISTQEALNMLISLSERIGQPNLGIARNEVRQVKGGYISYNPSTDVGEETAISSNGKKFFILLGDHREALKECKTFIECVKIFKNLIVSGQKVSRWSNYSL